MLRTYTPEQTKNLGVIYLLTSPIGKKYVGQSWKVKQRWYFYKKLILKCQTKLYNAFVKYGHENFKYEIIDLCETQKEMDSKEILYIELYNSQSDGYNLKSGGSKGKHSQESINKIRESVSKPENKAKMSKLHSGSGNPNYGIQHTDESKKKMSIIRTKKSNLRKNKYLYILENKDKEKFIVKNLNRFCQNNGLKSSYIRHVIYGNLKHYSGWIATRELLTEENKNFSPRFASIS